MGWGNPQPLAELKRGHAEQARLTRRAETAEAIVRRVQHLAEGEPNAVPVWKLRAALADPSDCAICLSPYAECQVHSLESIA